MRTELTRLGAYNYLVPEEVFAKQGTVELLIFVDGILATEWEGCGEGVTFTHPIEREDTVVYVMWLATEGDRGQLREG